ncbi:hypothetical protein SKAU_G00153940 [Synaphobranchus kaupii]|uniref:Phosphoenolpyruvate carboxykinase C-terminal P-loop domain-containing protein n=1 Tax=Synaphobranchus kaupii TaxID=118154 RepID=A0A9Q1FHI4_SYNKA|nr:hypothetical protein SKAU_G00153940 [Synaphobranchus kaupii]
MTAAAPPRHVNHITDVASPLSAVPRSRAENRSQGKVIMHDPFAMRPFFGYNFGHYLSHWLSMEQRPGARLPKIFHVNWVPQEPFRRFLWPGFGENIRVLEWVFRRLDGRAEARPSAVGLLPAPGALNLSGLEQQVDQEELFSLRKGFWEQEAQEIRAYFQTQVNDDLPPTWSGSWICWSREVTARHEYCKFPEVRKPRPTKVERQASPEQGEVFLGRGGGDDQGGLPEDFSRIKAMERTQHPHGVSMQLYLNYMSSLMLDMFL